jgi:hypothetical protein
MNVKLLINQVLPLIDRRISTAQVYKQLLPLAEQARLFFAEPQTGVDYLQWSLPGIDWTSFPEGDESQKAAVAQVYKDRRATMQAALEGSPLKDIVLTVPSEEFIYFRPVGTDWEIALTAWAFRYPDRPATGELDTHIHRSAMQQVDIGFEWDSQRLPDYHFLLQGQPRLTSTDGLFHVDGPLPVGKSYKIELLDGRVFTLTVEQGKQEYIFNLGAPEPKPEPVPEPEPQPEPAPEPEPEPQPEPAPEPEPEPQPEPQPEYVRIRLLDYGGVPMPNLPFTLKLKKKGRVSFTTDEDGSCLIPKEWFTDKEKVRYDIDISSEYQKSHDLHDPKKK